MAKIGSSTLPKSSSGGIKDSDLGRMSTFSIRSQEYRNRPLARYSVRGSFKKGGKVEKTGVYELHSGERVLNRKETKKYAKKKAKR